MKIQITNFSALIHWLSKAFRVLDVHATDESTDTISLADDPRDFFARLDMEEQDPESSGGSTL